ncbi:phage/plasmid primase, P4 family [Actinoplanes sp. NPDC049802]|uniref:phage/plasmid primase, P4 family n=1 Tax=Actinoplanes sp. NPDC049802 TaxID=3154742 RepID=UPI0033F4DFA9
MESAIDPEVARERGYTSIGRPTTANQDPRREVEALGFPRWATREDSYFPALLLPMYGPTGRHVSAQLKPRNAVPNREGKRMKYASPKGQSIRLDVHPRWTVLATDAIVPPIRDVKVPLYVTEGIKTADSMTSRGLCTVALLGVFNWRSTLGTLGDWEDVALRGREVTVCFDADARTNRNVLRAMRRLGRWLRSRGAKVRYLITPGEVNGEPTKGADDFFAAGGTLADFLAAASSKPPAEQAKEDTFTDSYLSEVAVSDVLSGSYVFTSGLGWLRWSGIVWEPVEDGVVLEELRLWARDEYRSALEEEREAASAGQETNTFEIEGWRRVQSANRLDAVLRLARNNGAVRRDASVFDTHRDLLSVRNGVVDLRTGELSEHDPALYFTKVATVEYEPGAEAKAFTKALEAVPADALDWLHLNIGQAASGHSAERMILLTGVGRNGKTALMGTIFRTLGGYAAKVPNTLLLKGKSLGSATPEKMTLRGVRLAYMEETPEEGYLDAQVAKELIDAEEIEGRNLYRPIVSWKPTHSIFLNTNHAPTVTDTGDGAWRRLARVEFPFRFRAPGQAIERENDREGDEGLKRDLDTDEARRAALAWIVAGAVRWYENEQRLPLDPESVEQAKAKWRKDSDDILRFVDEVCSLDPGRWVVATELYAEYARWAAANGHRAMSSKEFAKRMRSHGGLPAFVEAKKVRATLPGGSRPAPAWPGAEPKALGATVSAYVGLAFSEAS